MSGPGLVERYLAAAGAADVAVRAQGVLAPATVLGVPTHAWARAAEVGRDLGLRWAAMWADEEDPRAGALRVDCLLEGGGEYLLLRTSVADGEALPSHAAVYPAADRPERHARDLLGLRLEGGADRRRWTRHRAWPEGRHPLRASEPLLPDGLEATPPDDSYPFVQAEGSAVVEIPVGPVHAGIIEPGHFRFQAVGETVLALEERLGYVHKGIEKLAVGRDPAALARLAARVSGDSTVAHAWAACQALERALDIEVPARALWLRALLAERERIANHVGDVGAICNDVGFAFGFFQLARIREQWQRGSARWCGHRLMMDRVLPGGVAVDLDANEAQAMRREAALLAAEVAEVVERLEDSESLEDRLMTTGRLPPDAAAELGAIGYVGKASGQPFDVRRDCPYAPYDALEVEVPHYRAGDVAARAKVRAEEVRVSAGIIQRLLDGLPEGPIAAPVPARGRAVEGLGVVEGWRGEIVSYVRLAADGTVARFFPRDPSWLTWPALERLIDGNIVPDFPVCNKSVNGSYSGHDL